MLRHEQLPDPPMNELVEKIEAGMVWSGTPTDKLSSIPKINELNEQEGKIREELKNCVIDLISDNHGSRYSDLGTTVLHNLALRQIHGTGTLINGLYVALQGRDKTRGIESK